MTALSQRALAHRQAEWYLMVGPRAPVYPANTRQPIGSLRNVCAAESDVALALARLFGVPTPGSKS